ncbi:fumarate reductase subunit FrdD [Zobellella sp. DQSA1]|uniref:fumarate reductase subunit FrdD n=1 Tax=Zobellella sp. DQSA1 TaxID=3342386 RepID=UPI0035BEEBEE
MKPINPHPHRSEEPIWWSLFGAGGSWFAMLTPITVLLVGILVPLGLLNPEYLAFERVSGFATSWIGTLFILGSIILPLWHAMHRIHHGTHDLRLSLGVMGKVVCYGFAALVSLLAIILALGL